MISWGKFRRMKESICEDCGYWENKFLNIEGVLTAMELKKLSLVYNQTNNAWELKDSFGVLATGFTIKEILEKV